MMFIEKIVNMVDKLTGLFIKLLIRLFEPELRPAINVLNRIAQYKIIRVVSKAITHPLVFFGISLVLVVWINYCYFYRTPVFPCIYPDSWGYLTINPQRTIGSYLFYFWTIKLTGDLWWAVPIQLNLMLFSFFILTLGIKRLFPNPFIGIAALFLFMLDTEQLNVSFNILSESHFIFFYCIHIAAVLFLIKRFSLRWLVIGGLSLACLILLRPNAISFLISLPFLLLIRRDRRQFLLVASLLLIPVVTAIGFQMEYNRYKQGFRGMYTHTGLVLTGRLAWMIEEDMPTRHPVLVNTLAKNLKPLYASYPSKKERAFPDDYILIHESTTTDLSLYKYVLPYSNHYIDSIMPTASGIQKLVHIDKILKEIAVDLIRYDSWSYLKEIVSTYYAYWRRHALMVNNPISIHKLGCFNSTKTIIKSEYWINQPVLKGYIDSDEFGANTATVLEEEVKRGLSGVEKFRFAIFRMRDTSVLLVFILSFFSLFAVFWIRRLDVRVQAIVFLSYTLQSCYAILSIGHMAIRRYANALDIIHWAILLIFAFLVLEKIGKHLPSTRRVEKVEKP